MNNVTERIQKEIKKVIIGKDDVISSVLMAVLAGGHVLMEDVPGVGKTTLALAFAKVLGLNSKRVQFTSDTMPSDIIGFSVYDKARGAFTYKPGAVMTNLLLADEINRTSSKTQSALLEAMEEQNVTVDGETHPLPDPFIVLATQNPAGSAGTQLLPNSQLDRFMIRLSMGYPDFNSQVDILKGRHIENPLDSLSAAISKDELLELKRQTVRVFISDSVYEYVTKLSEATRNHAMVQLGLSPRGALAVCNMAKAYAFVSGNDYIVPEDAAAVFPMVCGHRLLLNSKARLNEYGARDIIAEIIDAVEMPSVKDVWQLAGM
jgi:MoxR-like ATPase